MDSRACTEINEFLHITPTYDQAYELLALLASCHGLLENKTSLEISLEITKVLQLAYPPNVLVGPHRNSRTPLRVNSMHVVSPQVTIECVRIQLRDHKAFNSDCQLKRQGLICTESSSCPFIGYGKYSSIYRLLTAAM